MAYLTIPELTSTQKQAMKSLMDAYFAQKNIFEYRGDIRRESYAYTSKLATGSSTIEGCMNTAGDYLLNCGVFAQMIWMGRNISDFTNHMTTPVTSITKAFDWGYYFDFLGSQNAYKVMKDSTTYYGANTYKISSSSKPIFITFDNASAMADDLHRKGYEIPYGQADIGDLVFYRADSITDGDTDELEATNFRNITHVGVVYNVNSDGTLTIMECTNAYTANIGKCGISTASGVTTFGLVRGSNLNYRVEMCARHPSAYGDGGNVPTKFTPYRRG